MSEVKVNKVSPRSGTTVTIGDSGDTINLVGTLQNNGSPLAGDISSVVAGTGLSGGATSGVATLNIEAAQPTITSLGTITSFRSTGIDDNSNALAITIDSSENVGIGTTSPTSTFRTSIKGDYSSIIGGIEFDSGGGDKFTVGHVNATSASGLLNVVGSANLILKTTDTERLRITSAGLVGIGTSSPGHKLEVSGDVKANNFTNRTSLQGIDPTPDDANRFELGGGYLNLYRDDTAEVNQIQFGKNGTLAAAFSTGANYLAIKTNGDNERMRIDSSGNLSIGHTTSGGAKLAICDGANAQIQFFPEISTDTNLIQHYDPTASAYMASDNRASQYLFKIGTAEKMRINSNGNIGIGTTNSTAAKVFIEHAGDVDDNGLYVYSNIGQTVPLVKIIQDGAGSTAPAVYIRNDDADGIALHLEKGDSNVTPLAFANQLFIEDDANTGLTIGTPTNGVGSIVFGDSGDADIAKFQYYHDDNSMRFTVNAAERMRIDSSGDVFIGKTSSNQAVAGIELSRVGVIVLSRPDASLLLNRTSTDGVMVYFNQNGSTEGNISVLGATVTYNGFTGTHWSRFTDNSTPTILRGTVLETLDEMCDWYNLEFDVTTQDDDGNDVTTPQKIPHVLADGQSVGDVITYNHEGTDYQATIVKETDVKHMMSKVSDNSDAKNVYGVFVAYDLDGEGYNDFYVASVGSYVVRIKSGETLAKGDLLQSNGDGTAKVQSDDNIKSSSFAKVLSTTIIETYEDGSYLVPCSLMC